MLGGGGGGVNKMRGGVEPIQHGNWMRLGKGLGFRWDMGRCGSPSPSPGWLVRAKAANYFAAGTVPPEMKCDPTAYIEAAPEVSAPNLHSQENEMKFYAIASAVVLFLVSTAAFAQDSKTPQGSPNSKAEQASQGPFS